MIIKRKPLSIKQEAENTMIEKLLPAKNFIYNSEEDLTYSHVCLLEDRRCNRFMLQLSCYTQSPLLEKKTQTLHLLKI